MKENTRSGWRGLDGNPANEDLTEPRFRLGINAATKPGAQILGTRLIENREPCPEVVAAFAQHGLGFVAEFAAEDIERQWRVEVVMKWHAGTIAPLDHAFGLHVPNRGVGNHSDLSSESSNRSIVCNCLGIDAVVPCPVSAMWITKIED